MSIGGLPGLTGRDVYGAGFRKEGVNAAGHPNMISLDGVSYYFFGLTERQAGKILDGVRLLNGRTGWQAYILQEAYYEEAIAARLYAAIFDDLAAGRIRGIDSLSRESIYRWVEECAPAVDGIKKIIAAGGIQV